MTNQEKTNVGAIPSPTLPEGEGALPIQNEKTNEMQLFAYLESLQPKWMRLCLRKPKEQYELQLKIDNKTYHYAEGKTLEELLVNLRSRIEKFQQAC